MFELLSEPVEKIDIEAIASIIRHWQQNGEREIANIDQAFRPQQAPVRPIDGKAHANLMSKIKEALDLASNWDTLLKGRPDKGQGYSDKVVNKLRNAVNKHGEKALNEVAEIEKTPLTRIAENLIQQYLGKFKKADSQAPDSRLRLRDLLNGDFARRSKYTVWTMQAIPRILIRTKRLIRPRATGRFQFPDRYHHTCEGG